MSKKKPTKLQQKIQELELANQELLLRKQKQIEELEKSNQELNQKLQQIDLSQKPKYPFKSHLSEEIIKDISVIVQRGIFNKTAIASFLGLHRNTINNWILRGEQEQEDPDSLYVQLVQIFEKAKQMFLMKNQLLIEKEAQTNWNAARWNIESRFPDMRVNAKQTSISVNDSLYTSPNGVTRNVNNKDEKIKREISFLITESVSEDEEDFNASSEGSNPE